MSDDREVLARLAALDSEVKAEVEAKARRKAEVIAQLREREAKKRAEQQALGLVAPPAAKAPQLAAPAPAPRALEQRRRAPEPTRDDDDDLGLESALTVARGAQIAKQTKDELARPREHGEKSWIASGLLSLFFGPVGWLYAGSLREAIPATMAWLLAAAIATKLPFFLLMPVMMVALPISGIAGVVYAVQHNRAGKRQRLWGKDDGKDGKNGKPKKVAGKSPKQLRGR